MTDVVLTDLRTLLPDWERSLKAARKASGTVGLYLRHARYLADWIEAAAAQAAAPVPAAVAEITHEHLERYFVELLERKTRRNGKVGETVKPTYAAAQYRSI